MTRTVLLVDDEPEITELLRLFLEQAGLAVVEARDGEEAWSLIESGKPVHLAVVDIMMPRLDGSELLKRLRACHRLPVILLSAKSADTDKILGLYLGADDFIAKPFNPLEVVARVQALLRRAYEFGGEAAAAGTDETVRIGGLALDRREYAVTKHGEPVELTALEYKLLDVFMSSPGRIFTKQQLFERVWADYYHEDANTVMVHISRLRGKIEDHPKQPLYIRSVRGIGYKFARREEFT